MLQDLLARQVPREQPEQQVLLAQQGPLDLPALQVQLEQLAQRVQPDLPELLVLQVQPALQDLLGLQAQADLILPSCSIRTTCPHMEEDR